jgi:hypothetical protein
VGALFGENLSRIRKVDDVFHNLLKGGADLDAVLCAVLVKQLEEHPIGLRSAESLTTTNSFNGGLHVS